MRERKANEGRQGKLDSLFHREYRGAVKRVLLTCVFSAVTLALLVLLLVFLLDDKYENEYAIAADAAADGAFQRGWLPDVLLPDATDIKELHYLEASKVRATFRYTGLTKGRIETKCIRLHGDDNVSSPFREWPDFLQVAQRAGQGEPRNEAASHLASRNISAYQCGDFTLALDDPNQMGYVWQ